MYADKPDLSHFTLLTSNADKIAEFSRFGLADILFAQGEDLDEVDGTPDEVIVYKAIAAGAMRIVEDSVVLIDGDPVVDIRWKLANLGGLLGKKIDFEVRLGVNDGTSVHVFKGIASGCIVEPRGSGGFGFDPFFEETETSMTFAELAEKGMKDVCSPRLEAVSRLLAWDVEFATSIASVPFWEGSMQGL